MIGNHVYPQGYRGFESLPLRRYCPRARGLAPAVKLARCLARHAAASGTRREPAIPDGVHSAEPRGVVSPVLPSRRREDDSSADRGVPRRRGIQQGRHGLPLLRSMVKGSAPSPAHDVSSTGDRRGIERMRRLDEVRAIVGTLDTSRVPECFLRVIRRHPSRACLLANRKGKTFWADVDAGSNRGLTLVSRIDGPHLAPAPSDPYSRRAGLRRR
jgi:hypothetical protein